MLVNQSYPFLPTSASSEGRWTRHQKRAICFYIWTANDESWLGGEGRKKQLCWGKGREGHWHLHESHRAMSSWMSLQSPRFVQMLMAILCPHLLILIHPSSIYQGLTTCHPPTEGSTSSVFFSFSNKSVNLVNTSNTHSHFLRWFLNDRLSSCGHFFQPWFSSGHHS